MVALVEVDGRYDRDVGSIGACGKRRRRRRGAGSPALHARVRSRWTKTSASREPHETDARARNRGGGERTGELRAQRRLWSRQRLRRRLEIARCWVTGRACVAYASALPTPKPAYQLREGPP